MCTVTVTERFIDSLEFVSVEMFVTLPSQTVFGMIKKAVTTP